MKVADALWTISGYDNLPGYAQTKRELDRLIANGTLQQVEPATTIRCGAWTVKQERDLSMTLTLEQVEWDNELAVSGKTLLLRMAEEEK